MRFGEHEKDKREKLKKQRLGNKNTIKRKEKHVNIDNRATPNSVGNNQQPKSG